MKKQMKLFTNMTKPFVLFVLLFALGVGQMWGTWYVPGTISYDGSERWAVTDNSMGGDNKQITFWALPAGTYKFQLTNGSFWSGKGCIKEIEGSDLSNSTDGDNATFTITKPKNITIKVVDESNWKVKVSAATPCAYIRYNWNEAGWNWSAAMSHNGDGTCSCIGQYGNTKAFDWQFSSAEQHYNDGTSGVTLVGNPQKGDKCVFTYNQSDQSLEIRKCNTTEATSYIYFDNTETGWTNTYKYFVIGRPVDATNPYSVTYALTEITNTKLWYYESTATWGDAGYYAAIGSNATFGTGNWNCDNLATASKYTAAYTSQYNLANTNHNIITPASSENGSAITMESKGTTYSSLNSLTVGYKYVLDGSDMTSGGAPAQITMNSYVFNAHNTVTGNTAQTISANASGTYSKSITAAYRGKVVLTQSNLSDGYKFIGWYNGNTQKETNNEYTYYPNENTTISAKYEYRWTLKGTFPDETEWAEDHYISNFSINASSEDVGYLDIDLPGNTSFQFKIIDRTSGKWHSCSGTTDGSEYNFTYVSSNGVAKDCSANTGNEKNMVFYTAAPGTYRFTWNADTKELTVTYPASYKVTYDGNDKTSGTVPTDNDYYAANATVTVKGNGGSLAKTGYNTLAYWNTESNGSGTDIAISTGTFSITGNTTLYAKWTQSITLDRESGTSGSTSVTATYNSATLGSYDNPERSGYTFGGYYSGDDGTGELIINTSKELQANKTVDEDVYTGAGGIWKHSSATTLHAKWTANPYTVTLNNLEASTAGTESVSVTYDATTGLTSAIEKPEKAHYDFGGYYTSNDEGVTLGTQLIDANGNWKKGVSGYTGTSGDNATWVYAGDITLYAKWTEHEYAITIEVTGSGSVNVGSSTTAKYVTASGDITATPSTGYSFREWGFSETGTGNYDVYVSDGSSYKSTDATIRIKAQRDGTLTANFTPRTYTVRFENLGADAGHKGSLDTTVTFNDTIHMKGRIEVPSKTNYDFGGYYISTDKGATLTSTQIIDANGNWKKGISGYTGTKDGVASWVCAGDTVLYAKWTETAYTITPSVSPAGAGSVNTVTDAHLVTPSSTITATPANAAWIFDYWEYGEHVGHASGSGNAITVRASQNSTITAHFKPRYELVGDIWDGSGNGGMPGWSYDGTGVFTFNSFTALGTGDGKGCDLSCSRTLNANTTYRFQIHDRETGNHGYATAATYIGDGDHLLFNTKDQNVMLAATGAGTYTFRITNITEDDGKYYPTVSVERPHEVNFGQKYQDIDGTLHTGTTGGTAAATAGGALTSGDYVTYNTSVTHTATPAGGYTFAGWWSSDAFEGDAFSGNNPMTYAVTSGDNAYAKFVEKSTSVTLANDGHGKVQIGGADATNTTCGVTTTRELTAVPNDGYKFSSWATSGDDITISSTSTNPTTLRGQGAGATSGQTVTANFTYRWALKAESDNWGSSEFIIGNISTDDVSGDVIGYVEISLAANTNYQFTMKDLLTNDIYKNNNTAVQYMTYSNHTDWGFATNYTFNCGITTAGKGTYKFIFNITDKTMTVTYPTSYLVNYGASVGGSVTSVVDGDENAVPNGGYVVAGGSVTYTAAAASGYTFVGWCNSDSYGDTFTNLNPWTNSSIAATSNAYAKFKSTNFVIYRSGDKDDDPRAAYDDVESYAGGTISEIIEFRMKVRELDKWYTLCLPFTVSAVKVWEDGTYYDLVPFYRTGGTYYTGDYIIRTPKQTTDFPIAEFGDWRDPTSPTGYKPAKNTPYIIQWHDSYFAEDGGRYISFFGESGQPIPTSFSAGSAPSSDNVVNVYGNNSMQIGSVAGAYLLENDYGSNGAWLRLEDASEARTILPFECYIRANTPTTTKYRVLRRDMTIDDTPTGLDQIINRKSSNRKFIKDGQLFIIRDDKMYNVMGMEVQQ